MKLYYTPTSPYARKARVVARERNLIRRIMEIEAHPYQDDAALIQANPVGLVPTLALDDGRTFYDSPLVCEFMDNLAPGERLIPTAGEPRWHVLRHVALADAVMDCAVAAVMECRRPEDLRSVSHIERAIAKIRRGLNGLANATKRGEFHMGSVATAVALEYLDYRHAHLNWRDEHGTLAAWLDDIAQRQAFQSTRPPP